MENFSILIDEKSPSSSDVKLLLFRLFSSGAVVLKRWGGGKFEQIISLSRLSIDDLIWRVLLTLLIFVFPFPTQYIWKFSFFFLRFSENRKFFIAELRRCFSRANKMKEKKNHISSNQSLLVLRSLFSAVYSTSYSDIIQSSGYWRIEKHTKSNTDNKKSLFILFVSSPLDCVIFMQFSLSHFRSSRVVLLFWNFHQSISKFETDKIPQNLHSLLLMTFSSFYISYMATSNFFISKKKYRKNLIFFSTQLCRLFSACDSRTYTSSNFKWIHELFEIFFFVHELIIVYCRVSRSWSILASARWNIENRS